MIEKQNLFLVHHIRFDEVKGTYSIISSSSEEWLQFNRLVELETLFWVVSNLVFKNLPNRSTDYSIDSKGWVENYAVENYKNYLITPDGNFEEVQELPIAHVLPFFTNWSEAYLYLVE